MLQDVLRDFVLYNAADKMVGRIDEFRPPSLERIIEDFRGAGMDGTMPVDQGVTLGEASWTTSGVDRGMYSLFGIINSLNATIIVRGAMIDPLTGVHKPIVHTLGGIITKIEPGAWKPGERSTLACTMKLVHYKLTHTLPGAPLIEINTVLGVRIINGVDQLIGLRLLTGR